MAEAVVSEGEAVSDNFRPSQCCFLKSRLSFGFFDMFQKCMRARNAFNIS